MNFFLTTPPMLTPQGTPLLGSPCVTVTGTPLYSAYPTPMHTSACTSYCPSYCSEYSYDSDDDNKLYDDNILIIDHEVHIVNKSELLSNLYAEINSIIEVVSDEESPLPVATCLQLLHDCNWDRQGLISDLHDDGHRSVKLSNYAVRESELVPSSDVCVRCSKADEAFHIGCSHSYCRACWVSYISSECYLSSMGVRCPHASCKHYLTRDIVDELAHDLLEIYDAQTLNSFVLSHPHLVYCPNSTCEAVLKVPPVEFQRVINCPACAHRFCVMCGGDHEPATCDDMRIWSELIAQDTALQAQIRLQSLQLLRDIEAHEVEIQRAQLQCEAETVFRVDADSSCYSPVAVHGYELQSRYWRDLAVRHTSSHVTPSPVMWRDIVTEVKLKNCPNCEKALRGSGIAHHACNFCSHEFCWVCLGNWSTHESANCPHLSLTIDENRRLLASKLAAYLDKATDPPDTLLPESRVNVIYEKFSVARAKYDMWASQLKRLHGLAKHESNDIWMLVWRLVVQCVSALMLSHIRLLFTAAYQQHKDLEYRQICLSDSTDTAIALLQRTDFTLEEAMTVMEPLRRYLDILITEKLFNEDV